MLREKMFCGKYSCRLIKTSDEVLGKHLNNFNKVAGI